MNKQKQFTNQLRNTLAKKYFSNYNKRIYNKFTILKNYLGLNSKQLYTVLHEYLQRLLEINLDEERYEYCLENELSGISTFKLIKSKKELRNELEGILDDHLKHLDLYGHYKIIYESKLNDELNNFNKSLQRRPNVTKFLKEYELIQPNSNTLKE